MSSCLTDVTRRRIKIANKSQSIIKNLLSKCVTDKFTSAGFQEVFDVLFSVSKKGVRANEVSGRRPCQTDWYLTLGAQGSPLGKDTLSAGR